MPTPRKKGSGTKRIIRKKASATSEALATTSAENRPEAPIIPFIKIEMPSTPVVPEVGPKEESKMEEIENDNPRRSSGKIIVLSIALFVVLVASLVFLIFSSKNKFSENTVDQTENVTLIKDELIIPDTKNATKVDGQFFNKNATAVPIISREQLIVADAKLTLKGGYESAKKESSDWSLDAKLLFIKSLGSVNQEGQSSAWQIVFASQKMKSGYEIIIQGDQVISKKEIVSTSFGFDLPGNWFDSSGVVTSLRTSPEFEGATITAINFFYSTDAGNWIYGIATSKGNSSIHVK